MAPGDDRFSNLPRGKQTIVGPDGQQAEVDQDGNLKVTQSAGDVEIGAVELKDAASDTRAKVGAAVSIGTADYAVAVSDPNVRENTNIPSTPTGGSKTISTSGTAEALGASLETKAVYIRAKSTNTGNVYVGDSSVDKTSNKQVQLAANESVTLSIKNRSSVYIDVDTNGDGVDYLALS